MTKFIVNVTKEVYKTSQYCGKGNNFMVGHNCAIAKAIHVLFPNAWIKPYSIAFYNDKNFTEHFGKAELPENAIEMISIFDKASPEERLLLPEISFEIEVSDEILENVIPIEADIKEILKNSSTLQLV